MSKTSEKIIEEFDEKFVGGFDSIQENSPYREQIKSFLLQAMKTAVEERNREIVAAFKETRDACKPDEIHCGCLGYCEWIIEGKPGKG